MYSIKKIQKTEVKTLMSSFFNEHTICAYCVYENEKMLGQVVAYFNPHIGNKTLLLGGYEMSNNTEASKKLLAHVITEAKEDGYKNIIGPMNGSTWEAYRFTEPSTEKSFFLEPSQEAYYIPQWERAGFEKSLSFYSSITKLRKGSAHTKEEKKMETHFLAKNVSIEKWGKFLSEEQWKKLADFNNKAFKKNTFFSPITQERFKQKYSAVLEHIDTQFMYFVKQGEELVGILFAYPDLLNKTGKSLVLKTLARLPKPDLKGLGSWLAAKLHNEALAKGYEQVIHALMHTDNASTIRSNEFNGKLFRNYSLYKMELS